MNNNKKIAILCNYVLTPERVGGMDRFFWLFDKKCKDQGYNVSWYFPNVSSHGEYDNLNMIDPINKPLETFFIDNISQNDLKYDTVITHFVELCTPFYKKIKFHYPSKIIVVDHNPRPLEGFSLKRRVIKKIKGFLYAKYIDKLIGVSQYTQRHILKDYGFFLKSKTKVIYNGIAENLFLKNENRNPIPKMFILTSNLRYIKGIQDLIEAVSFLPTQIISNCFFHVYGEGNYEKELKALVSHYKLQKSILFFGSSPILNEIYSKYDYMIQPTYMECFSLSILESLSANVPVITTTVGGNAEVVIDNENGFLIEPKNSRQLSELLLAICQGKKGIYKETYFKIRNDFNLELMVNNHVKELNL
jgi:L-malate glycosyltransferase